MHGSFQNRMYEAMTNGAPQPQAGMAATITGYTDRHAATVICWDSNKEIITVQQDTAKRVDDRSMSESQKYEFSPNPDGTKWYFRRNKKTNRWDRIVLNAETGRWNKHEYGGLILGMRNEYYDYSF